MTLPGTDSSGTVLIGTYTSDKGGGSRGIYAAEWDGEAGVLGAPRLFTEMENPSFLAVHPALPFLYAASEMEEFQGRKSGAVAFFRLGGGGAAADPRSSEGTSPCHLAVDPKGEFIVVSNYGSGTAAVFPLEDGLPAGEAAVLRFSGSGPDGDRQAGPHAHSAVFDPSGDRFYIQDLGTDQIWGFRLERAARAARPLNPPFTKLAPGSGPRHMAFHPRGPWAYLINELDNTMTALSWDRGSGGLAPFQTVSTLPEGKEGIESYCADVHVSPGGDYLYGSNRGHDSLAVWRIDQKDGRMTPIQHVSCGGVHPRNFTLSPDGRWLLCANMNSDNLVVFRRDAATGRLARTSETAAPAPVCLVLAAGALAAIR